MWPIALPPLEPFGNVIAGAVAIKVHHVQNIAFGLIFWHRVFIVRAEYIQVVVDAHIDVVVSLLESGVGAVPVDGVAVGHRLGAGLLPAHAHPQRRDRQQQHLHVRHRGETDAEKLGRGGGGGVCRGGGKKKIKNKKGRSKKNNNNKEKGG